MPGAAGSTPVTSMAMGARGRVHRAPLLLAGVLTVVVGVSGGAGVYFAADRQTNSVQRIAGPQADALADVLSANVGPAENYLIVGSDSRANGDPDGNDDTTAGCDCSDTIMILRRDPDARSVDPQPAPRPLGADRRSGRSQGQDQLGLQRRARRARRARSPTDSRHPDQPLRGDRLRRVHQARRRDRRRRGLLRVRRRRTPDSGLDVQPGCQNLTARMALAYARSRHYEEWRSDENGDYDWVPDDKPTSAASSASSTSSASPPTSCCAEVDEQPVALGDLLDAATNVITFDDSIDVLEAGRRPAPGGRRRPADVLRCRSSARGRGPVRRC